MKYNIVIPIVWCCVCSASLAAGSINLQFPESGRLEDIRIVPDDICHCRIINDSVSVAVNHFQKKLFMCCLTNALFMCCLKNVLFMLCLSEYGSSLYLSGFTSSPSFTHLKECGKIFAYRCRRRGKICIHINGWEWRC